MLNTKRSVIEDAIEEVFWGGDCLIVDDFTVSFLSVLIGAPYQPGVDDILFVKQL